MANKLIKFLGILGIVTSLIALALNFGDPKTRAVLKMAWGVIIFWIILCGGLMYKYRSQIREFIISLPGPWQAKFFLMFAGLAMLEEAVTVSMTNAAPLFGVKYGEAYITASGNYFDVILFHSVIVFIPMFAAWTWLMHRYKFSPQQTFLLWGITGWLGEIGFSGPGQALAIGFWVFVYGLMAWLPAYCVPQDRQAKEVKWYHLFLPIPVAYLSLVIFGILGSILAKLAGQNPYANHPRIHF